MLPLVLKTPRPVPGVTLHLGRCQEVAWPDGDLVIADPPWSYVQKTGATRADNHYRCMTTGELAEVVEAFAWKAPRLALWVTWPFLGAWMAATTGHGGWAWGPAVSGGSWHKSGDGVSEGEEADSGAYGQGYHWAGCSELLLLYTSRKLKGVKPYNSHSKLRNAWSEPPGEHSAKPVAWQRQMIERWVPPGGVVLDPFAGLGSVGVATVTCGGERQYFGCELDESRRNGALMAISDAYFGIPRLI